MFVSEKLVYIQLHKTGCSHIGRLLAELLPGEFVGQHRPATSQLLASKRFFLGSIRNPWDWYVSLWAYGCDGKGHVYDRVTKARGPIRALGWRRTPFRAARALLLNLLRPTDDWKRCYSDVNDVTAFQKWLHRMHAPRHWNDFGEGYGQSPISRIAGLLTYRYLTLFCRHSRELHRLSDLGRLQEYERGNCYIDYFIRNESLETDLFEALERCGVGVTEERRMQLRRFDRTNSSSRKRPASDYYDLETAQIVAAREKLIIDKFGYTMPAIQHGANEIERNAA